MGAQESIMAPPQDMKAATYYSLTGPIAPEVPYEMYQQARENPVNPPMGPFRPYKYRQMMNCQMENGQMICKIPVIYGVLNGDMKQTTCLDKPQKDQTGQYYVLDLSQFYQQQAPFAPGQNVQMRLILNGQQIRVQAMTGQTQGMFMVPVMMDAQKIKQVCLPAGPVNVYLL